MDWNSKIFCAKNHYQDSKCCIQTIIIKLYQLFSKVWWPSNIIYFLMIRWLTLKDWVFLLDSDSNLAVGSQTAIKERGFEDRIHLTKGEKRLAAAWVSTKLLSGSINYWNWYILWLKFWRVFFFVQKHLAQ